MQLEKRDMEFLSMIAAGYTNRRIGERFFLTEGTVGNRLADIYKILRVGDRTGAVVTALKGNMINSSTINHYVRVAR